MPKLARFALAQIVQLPIVAPGLLPSTLNDACSGEGMKRFAAEPRNVNPSIQAVQGVGPIALGHELCNCSRAHTTPIDVPALTPAVARDLALGGLVVWGRFCRAVAVTEVLKDNRDRIEPRR